MIDHDNEGIPGKIPFDRMCELDAGTDPVNELEKDYLELTDEGRYVNYLEERL